MASSPVKFFSVFLAVSVFGWVVFTFAARLLAWFLSRVLSASVGFRVAGCNCLRDVTIKFCKGSVESVSIGEIKLSFRKSLVKLSFGVISKDPKLQLLIHDLEIVTRPSSQDKKMRKSTRPRSTGKGKWLVTSSMARLLSVSVTDLMIKVPKGAVDIKELTVDTFKIAGPNHILGVKLHLLPLNIHFGDLGFTADPMGSCNQCDAFQSDQASVSNSEKSLAPFVCEDLLVTCDFGHEKEKGIKIINLELKCGYAIANIDERLFRKKHTISEHNSVSSNTGDAITDTSAIKQTSKRKSILPVLKKQMLVIPDKVSFSVPKLDVKFRHLHEGLSVDNNITGIQFTCAKSLPQDDLEEATPHLDVQIDLSEIHLVREGSSSLLEVLKVVAIASLDVPVDPFLAIRAEIDAKLGGTQCNVMLSRLMPWMRLHSLRTKGMKLSKRDSNQEISQRKEIKPILWTCTVAAPEMTVMLYSLNGSVLYHACSQSSHLFANNIASKGIQIHTELGELLVHMAEEYREFMKENIFGVDTCSGSLMHIARVSLDWGYRESDIEDMVETSRHALVFAIDISDIEVKFCFKHLESLVLNLMSFRTLFKNFRSSGGSAKEKNLEHRGEKKTKGVKRLKLILQKFSITYCGDTSIVNMPIADPKRVNYGSQGGQVIVSVSADGTPRTASITSVLPGSHLRFSASLVISHLSMCIDKERKTTEAELERVRTIYEELPEDHSSGVRVTLLDMQNAKIVRRSSGHTEVAVCSLFSATDIYLRWEPDAHLALYETFIRFKHFLHNNKFQDSEKPVNTEVANMKANEHGNMTAGSVKTQKSDRKGSIFAIDVDVLRVSAELADGVEASMHVQSIFTENAKIGVLSEGLSLTFNGARVLRSTRIQISCIPFTTRSLLDAKVEPSSKRDWVVQGLDVHICMPYRLPLRAIEDAVEDMIRALKLVSSAKRSMLCPDGKEKSKKANSGASKFGSVKFVLRKLTADIEEEPIQGWLDEHYRLMRSKVCELDVRLKFLEEATSGSVDLNNRSSERKILYDGVEIGMHDTTALQRLQEEIHNQAFRSYYVACRNMVPSEGSGACSEGFQAGFKPSSRRASLLSLSASELDVTLTRIDGGEIEMVEFIKGLDPVCQEQNIPFSRLYGSDISVLVGSLVVQLRDYTSPLFSSLSGKCQGRIVLAQQATCFQPQIHQDLYIGRWQKVKMLRSASGTTPAVKMYSNLPIYFQKGEISFGVGYEPSFADISYAFQVALRRVNLSTRASCSGPVIQPPKKERSLPWWDDMRYYLHGKIVLYFNETRWKFLASTNPYEHTDKLQIVSEYMEIQQTDGHVDVSAKEFKIYISSLESIMKNCSLKVPSGVPRPFIYAPLFSLNVVMDWQCESGNPLNHYLHALPVEGEPRKKVYDPFRSTYLSLRWNFSLRPLPSQYDNGPSSPFYGNNSMLRRMPSGSSRKMADDEFPTMNLGAHDLAWVFKWWSLNYGPPHKLRSFSRWRRFGIPRAARSGNLSLDKVLVEFFFRVDATPCCIKHVTLTEDDPACGLTFKMSNLKYELCYSRGKQQYTFDCKRESLDLVYRGLDLHRPEVYLMRESNLSTVDNASKVRTAVQQSLGKFVHDRCNFQEKHEDGFLLSSDYFTIRRQTRKADPERLMGWQDTGRNLEITYVRSEFEEDSESDHTLSEPSDDDDDFNVVLADNCQRVFVYGLKILWTIENRDAVWSWVGGISKAFEPPKPSPSRQYAQRKMIEERNAEGSKLAQDANSSINVGSPSVQHVDTSGSSSPLHSKANRSSDMAVKHGIFDDSDKGGTPQFMVNVITPQFNLHSEEANGRFLLAAASGRVLARSFHSVVHVGKEMLEQALGASSLQILELQPEMTWNKFELSVMLKDVQAHVAPTDVDPGAGLQWLPRILGSSEKLKRTGALLERVFMPCQMYFRYTRHKGGTADLRVKPLKELCFNSPDITATMTSRQFQVMFDVLRNLLFARPPKPRKNSLQYPSDDEDIEEEADEVVPDGVEEVELAKINLEQKERERKLLLDDIRSLTGNGDNGTDQCHSAEKGDTLWMISSGKTSLVEGLKNDLINLQKSRRSASSALRKALQNAAQLRLTEKEKNKTPSCAMRISMKISKVVWSMLADGNTFAEAEINDMVYDFDRDYKDIGVARFTTKYFVVRNCMANAKCDTLLSAWNTPPGKINMLRVDAKQGAPKDGSSPLELFQVEIYPLRIYLSEAMYRMMWDYFFPEEDDSQRRQEVWRVSTSTGPRRTRRLSSGVDPIASSSYSVREHELPGKSGTIVSTSTNVSSWQGLHSDNSQVSKFQSIKANMVCGSHQELRRSSSFERTWDENAAEGVTGNDVVSLVNSSAVSSKGDASNSVLENPVVGTEMWRSKTKDSKPTKSGRLSHEEKKVGKSNDEKKTRARKLMEFHNIKISQVELLVTYEGSRLAINDLRLLMDTFHKAEFTGTWRRLFSRVKKHIIWGVLKSVTGMQGKKFSNHRETLEGAVPENDLNLSDSDVGHHGRPDQLTASWLKRPGDGAGDGFVTSIRGLFNTQRRKAKAFVIRTMRGDGHNDEYHDEWSESDGEYPFARQLTITKAKKLIRRKFRPRGQKSSGLSLQDSLPSSPRETTPYQSDSSRSSYEDLHEQ
ncbi:hypothetical protein BS78_01G124900 [Paspalum vaginatum]|nr:hypothetical protein BS78_01G124900 [Paspalum vaginatum]